MRHALSCFGLALAFFTLACGGKRPPVVATSSGTGTDNRSAAAAENLGEGRDIEPIREDATSSTPLSDASGEGGPLEDIRFDYDSAALTDAARELLGRHAAWMKGRAGLRIVVEGHCDERGSVDYNLALGDQRARATRDYLVSLGVPAGMLTTTSFGKERPLDRGTGEAAWARNRRAHFAVSR